MRLSSRDDGEIIRSCDCREHRTALRGACGPGTIEPLSADAETEAALATLLERFCSATAARDADRVIELFAPGLDVVVVTSGERLVRGPDRLREFLRAYGRGPATYSWTWDRVAISSVGLVAWLVADGTETASTVDGSETRPYRMTMVCERRECRWLLRQLHGSSPS